MRTAGYGQAAVPRERVRRRRSDGLPEPLVLGRWENILRTVTRVERYPEVPGFGWGHPVLPWGAFAEAVDFRKFPACVEGGMGSCGELCGRYKQQASCNGR